MKNYYCKCCNNNYASKNSLIKHKTTKKHKNNIKIGGSKKMYTYLINGKNFGKDIEKELLNRGCWVKAKKNDKNVDFIYIDGDYKFNDIIFKYPKTNLINIMGKEKNDEIAVKSILHNNLSNKFPRIAKKYLPEQYPIDLNNINLSKFKNIISNNTWFLKPCFGYAGDGIIYVNNYYSFENKIDKLKMEYKKSIKKFKKI